MLIGVDSWNPPTQAAIDALKEIEGFAFWAGYIGGNGLYLNTPWPSEAWDLLKANNIQPLPIWVPNQNCTDNPETVAQEAIAAAQAMGLHGVVAIDSEASMAQVLNYANYLEQIFTHINQMGWLSVNYAGAHYLSPLASSWIVKWGEHEEIPLSGEAIQYGPYVLRTNTGTAIMDVDSDSCDDHFPLASWTDKPTTTEANPAEPTTTPIVVDQPKTEMEEELMATVLMNDGHGWFAVDTVNWTKKPIPTPGEGSSLSKVFSTLSDAVPDFLATMTEVQA